jgi:integrase
MERLTTNDFMTALAKRLMDTRKDAEGKEKPGLTESSAIAYIKTLYNLNDKKPFKSLSFLKNTDKIDVGITDYADNTKKTILGVVVGVLRLANLKGYTKALNHYLELLGVKAKELREAEGTNQKTEKQEKNWITMDDIDKMKAERWTALMDKIKNKSKISPELYEALLNYLVVALYTETSPRRNQDYMKMTVVKKWKDGDPTNWNYLDTTNNRFIFNVYKTARKYGQHKVDIPDGLNAVIKKYMKYHPNKGNGITPFLVHADGAPLTAINSITRILNKWFGKKVGSSMLRHIYLSSKYNIEEMKKDALDMGHSVEQQKGYMKE